MAISTTLTVVGVGDWDEDEGKLSITLCYNDGEGNCYTDDAVLIDDEDGLQIDWFEGCPNELANILEQLDPDDLEQLDREAGELAAKGGDMTETNVIDLGWDEWEATFCPVPNHFECEHGIDNCQHEEEHPTKYETHGKEAEYIRTFPDRNRVWTLVVEGDTWTILEGIYVVNRMGYYITRVPFEPDTHYNVHC